MKGKKQLSLFANGDEINERSGETQLAINQNLRLGLRESIRRIDEYNM